MNESNVTTRNNAQQAHPRYSLPLQDPLKQAAIANGSLKINLRRLRRDLVGPRQLATTSRLLDVTDAIGRALDWLRCRPGATDDSLRELIQLASDPHAIPDVVEAVTQ